LICRGKCSDNILAWGPEPRAQVVNLHCALTNETQHIINEETLKLMKPSAILVNTAHGGSVEMAVVAVALEERRLFGASIDVMEVELAQGDTSILHCHWLPSTAIA
jgi:glycerate dehydrogenase